MEIKNVIKENNLEELFSKAKIGLEKEGQRVLEGAVVTKTPHPAVLEPRHDNLYIQTDFAESQVELITTPENSEKDVLRVLNAVHEVVLKNMPHDEYIWPLSVPAHLPAMEDIKVAQFENKWDVDYREYLVGKYGKYKQMISGIHYNFQLDDELVERLAEIKNTSLVDFKNDIYMKLARQFIRYQWLLVYLFGATPFAEDKYFDRKAPKDFVRSLRTSRYGYVNDEDIIVSYSSLEKYISDLRGYVDNNKLIAEKEFYSSVRFRGADTVIKLPETGIKYMEFRLFDINPFAPFGILEKDVRFIHLFLKTIVLLDEEDRDTAEKIGHEYSEKVALANPFEKVDYVEEGLYILSKMKEMVQELGFLDSDIELINEKEKELLDPSLTIAARMLKECDYNKDNVEQFGMKLAKEYKNTALREYYSLSAYNNMELSTQAVIEDAIKNGIKVQIIDENDQFIRLEYKDKVEYVKNGNMTSKDSYISPLIMENKVVTKKVLAEKGFRVPAGYEVSTKEEAKQIFNFVKNKPIVIKPKSTNFGLGISIFKHGTDVYEDYEKAIEFALKEDKDILIEEFIEGVEYRFFVIEGATQAVLLRVPANVIGDGVHSIKELVALKNENPLRGDAKKTPLKKIELGEIEKLQLKEQGFTFETILEKNEIAYLRENSNISTGGDSVDMTDEVHESYKKLAVEITDAMMAKVCGVDLIIPNIKEEATENNYGVIEANFNPMMMMHIYPHSGKSRRLSLDVLKMLFPEKIIK